jgi:hypothetical protein
MGGGLAPSSQTVKSLLRHTHTHLSIQAGQENDLNIAAIMDKLQLAR